MAVYRPCNALLAPWCWLARLLRRAAKSHQAAARRIGIDPDACFWQAQLWHDPAACLAHLRRHLPGLHQITPAEHDARIRERQAQAAADA